MLKTKIKFHMYVLGFALLSSCIEEIPLQTQTEFDEALIVEATITDVLKPQTIRLSNAYRLESNGPSPASNAVVTVTDNLGNVYSFNEVEAGLYQSAFAFAAQPNTNYELEILNDGVTYNSDQASFSAPTQIDSLYVERGFNENGDEGVSVFVDAFDPSGNSNFYRYEYEETYKIIAPRYSPFRLEILNDEFPIFPGDIPEGVSIQDFLVDLVSREESVQVCYNTVAQNTIIISNTNEFAQGALTKFRTRFLNRDNYIISHRYSILVRQYAQSQEAYNFYRTLRDFSLSESIFSENQVGFLEGNVSTENQSNKVTGYFEVSPVDEKRIFFNYSDLFPNEELPPYALICDNEADRAALLYQADPLSGIIGNSELISLLKDGFQYTSTNSGTPEFPSFLYPFLLVPPPCGDCTFLGTTAIPDFWEE